MIETIQKHTRQYAVSVHNTCVQLYSSTRSLAPQNAHHENVPLIFVLFKTSKVVIILNIQVLQLIPMLILEREVD